MNSDEATIAIMGKELSARHDRIPIDQLRFLPDNPRVYAAIREMPASTISPTTRNKSASTSGYSGNRASRTLCPR